MYPQINPILAQFGPFALHWYGLIIAIALTIGTSVASRYATLHGKDSAVIWDMLIWILIPGLIGARLFYVFIDSPRGANGLGHYLAHPIEILQIWNGGINIYGAFIFGGIALYLFMRWRKLQDLIYLDAIGLGVLIGQVIGRLGNFTNQEYYGPPTTLPWGLMIDAKHRFSPYNNLIAYPNSILFQPLFLYEMLWDSIGFVLLIWIAQRFEKDLRQGDIFLLFLVWSPLGRFFIEFLRTDSWYFPGTSFDTIHILAVCAIIGASSLLYLRHREQRISLQPGVAIAAAGSTGLSIAIGEILTPDPVVTTEQEHDEEVENAVVESIPANETDTHSVTADVSQVASAVIDETEAHQENAILPDENLPAETIETDITETTSPAIETTEAHVPEVASAVIVETETHFTEIEGSDMESVAVEQSTNAETFTQNENEPVEETKTETTNVDSDLIESVISEITISNDTESTSEQDVTMGPSLQENGPAIEDDNVTTTRPRRK